MTADATAAAVSRPEAGRPAIARAGRVVATGVALGLVGQPSTRYAPPSGAVGFAIPDRQTTAIPSL